MLQLHTIKPNPGAKHRKKRLGNGESSGLGKTCGKGNKGQKARSGGTIRPGFEGGQMPLHRRLPKKGFNNTRFQDKILIVNLSQLERVFEAGATVDENTLRAAKLVQGPCDAVKLLGNGTPDQEPERSRGLRERQRPREGDPGRWHRHRA